MSLDTLALTACPFSPRDLKEDHSKKTSSKADMKEAKVVIRKEPRPKRETVTAATGGRLAVKKEQSWEEEDSPKSKNLRSRSAKRPLVKEEYKGEGPGQVSIWALSDFALVLSGGTSGLLTVFAFQRNAAAAAHQGKLQLRVLQSANGLPKGPRNRSKPNQLRTLLSLLSRRNIAQEIPPKGP